MHDPTPDKFDAMCHNPVTGEVDERAANAARRAAQRETALGDTAAERSWLGGIIEQGSGAKSSGLMPNDFTLVEHQLIMSGMLGLEDAKLAITPISLADRLDTAECPDLDELGRGLYFALLKEKYGFYSRNDQLPTYASIIQTLLSREYVLLDSRRFRPTDVGRVVAKFLSNHFTRYVDYDFTAKLEDELDAVSRGEEDWVPLLEKFWKPFKQGTPRYGNQLFLPLTITLPSLLC